ncbi:hypothetical protein HMF7854_03470 [Sphingomonas ginkgonis]|uniref:Uncharacterized protein n=1 Tax=Sphingomonas ginkgonis TaxID=2315330 RepID=A0A3R9WMK9_9SPHN|nr:hypothetical protein [Sphingomonas ginkgonis]RST29990.1 hypothetical protein HMF7854_03470 [Sphingomonas ginkgonis]
MTELQRISIMPQEQHRQATDEINCWRGHCLDWFARVEQASFEVMEAMVAKNLQTHNPATFGARLAALEEALADHPSAVAKKCLAALLDLRAPLKLRNAIVHSTGSIWFDQKGRWLWRYRFRSAATRHSVETGAIDQADARELLKTLSGSGRSLCDRLANLTASL